MESMQHQLQEVEKRRNDLMPEHQKVQKMAQNDTKHPRQEKTYRKKAGRQENKCGKSEKKLTQLSDKVDKNTMSDAETEAELQDCRLEKKEEVAMHRKRWNAVWKRWWNRFSLWEREQGMFSLKTDPSIFHLNCLVTVFFGP